MIDKETNSVYFSSLLQTRYPKILDALTFYFNRDNISYGLLEHTKDMWAVDYMPIQVRPDLFVQFKYDPDYLRGKWSHLRTDASLVTKPLGIIPERSSIVLDGGNVVRSKHLAILTNKVFSENSTIKESILLNNIAELLEVEKVITVPTEPGDYIGHSDGMVRFIDDNTVLLNHYPFHNKTYSDFGYAVRSSLRNAGLEIIELPYTSWSNSSPDDANGCYINYLEVGNHIFLPWFGLPNDIEAINRLQQVFPSRQIVDIQCSKLAKEGGVLNCISWNVFLQS